MKHLNISHSRSPHLVWRSTTHNPRDVRRTNIKARLLCGAYILQTTRDVFNQTRNTICPLCEEEDEDITHFLLICSHLEEHCRPLLKHIIDTIPIVYQQHPSQWSSELLIQLVLDPTHLSIQNILHWKIISWPKLKDNHTPYVSNYIRLDVKSWDTDLDDQRDFIPSHYHPSLFKINSSIPVS